VSPLSDWAHVAQFQSANILRALQIGTLINPVWTFPPIIVFMAAKENPPNPREVKKPVDNLKL
jgi:hypothetical protein